MEQHCMMLHHQDHATKVFSTPGCEKLLLPMVLDMPFFWTEVQVLNFHVGREKSLLNCIPTENTTTQQTAPLKVPAEQLGVLWLEGQDRVG